MSPSTAAGNIPVQGQILLYAGWQHENPTSLMSSQSTDTLVWQVCAQWSALAISLPGRESQVLGTESPNVGLKACRRKTTASLTISGPGKPFCWGHDSSKRASLFCIEQRKSKESQAQSWALVAGGDNFSLEILKSKFH